MLGLGRKTLGKGTAKRLASCFMIIVITTRILLRWESHSYNSVFELTPAASVATLSNQGSGDVEVTRLTKLNVPRSTGNTNSGTEN